MLLSGGEWFKKILLNFKAPWNILFLQLLFDIKNIKLNRNSMIKCSSCKKGSLHFLVLYVFFPYTYTKKNMF